MAAQVEATRDVFRENQLIQVEDSADAEAEFVEIQAGIAALQAPLGADARLTLARRAVALGDARRRWGDAGVGRLWSLDVHAATGRRVELLGELSALTVLAEQSGAAWRDGVLFVRHQSTTEPLLDAVRRQVDHLPFVARRWLCVALRCVGRREEAADESRALAGRVTAVPSEAPEFLMTVADAADVCAWLADEASAATLYDIMLPYELLRVMAHAHAPYHGPRY